jgi:hypothetical protein
MRKIVIVLISIYLTIFLISCRNENEGSKHVNSFQYKDTEYKISKVFLLKNPKTKYLELVFMSDNWNNLLSVHIYTLSEKYLDTMVYTNITRVLEAPIAPCIDEILFSCGDDGDVLKEAKAVNVWMRVKKIKDNYSIEYVYNLEDNSSISGNWSGKLDRIE